jgi:putative FmdB family regulatory protein
MPLYEYRCQKCEHTFEILASGQLGEESPCPQCGATATDRLIGLPARSRATDSVTATNCRGNGPPCGAPGCGRRR